MPSVQDVIDAINNTDTALSSRLDDVKTKLDTADSALGDIEGKLDNLIASVNVVDADVKKMQQLLIWGFGQLITLGQYANQALFQNDQQNDTIICLLEQISTSNCGIWNEAHRQTELQSKIDGATRKLAALYAATHATAAITLEREEALRREIEACCPPKPPEPVCQQEPCPSPPEFTQQPPATEPPPDIGPPPLH